VEEIIKIILQYFLMPILTAYLSYLFSTKRSKKDFEIEKKKMNQQFNQDIIKLEEQFRQNIERIEKETDSQIKLLESNHRHEIDKIVIQNNAEIEKYQKTIQNQPIMDNLGGAAGKMFEQMMTNPKLIEKMQQKILDGIDK
jgi:hypothetical protein